MCVSIYIYIYIYIYICVCVAYIYIYIYIYIYKQIHTHTLNLYCNQNDFEFHNIDETNKSNNLSFLPLFTPSFHLFIAAKYNVDKTKDKPSKYGEEKKREVIHCDSIIVNYAKEKYISHCSYIRKLILSDFISKVERNCFICWLFVCHCLNDRSYKNSIGSNKFLVRKNILHVPFTKSKQEASLLPRKCCP